MTYQFTMNKTCNWNCSYCCQGDRSCYKTQSDDFLIDEFKKYMYLINKNTESFNLILLGGEPGLWSEYLWDNILSTIAIYQNKINKIIIYTNGMFFTNPRIEKINKFDRMKFLINYHCICELLSDVYINKIHGWDVEYIVVLTHDNIKYFEGFLLTNKHIYFKALLSTTQRYGIDKSIIDSDYGLIQSIVKKAQNFNYNNLRKIDSYNPFNLKKFQNVCSKNSDMFIFDLSEQIFMVCCMSLTYYSLSEENYYKFLSKTLPPAECGNCLIPTRVYGNNTNNI